jgi:hypothetical protein
MAPPLTLPVIVSPVNSYNVNNPRPSGKVIPLKNSPEARFGSAESSGPDTSTPSPKPPTWIDRLLQPFKDTWHWFIGLFTGGKAKESLSKAIETLNEQVKNLTQKVTGLQKEKEILAQEKDKLSADKAALLQDKHTLADENAKLHEAAGHHETIIRSVPPEHLRTPKQIQHDQAELKRRMSQPLPYDATQVGGHDAVDLLEGKNVITVHPQAHHSAHDAVMPLSKPSLKTIEHLKTSDHAITMTVPGHPNKQAVSNPQARITGHEPDLNQVHETDFTYDFNVKWGTVKCVRDLFQNFSDSHGRTLAGTKVSATRDRDGTYTVRVQGQAEYDHQFVKNFISSKGDDQESAGGFGEGTKIMTLNFLKEHGAEAVTFSSRNWSLEYSGKPKTIAGIPTHIMVRKLTEVPDHPGNSVEIKTKDPQLVAAVFNGVDLFYHPANPDFASPTSENKVGGFRYLGLDSQGKAKYGNIYPTKQRYEYRDNDHWDNRAEFVTLWTNQNVLKDLGVVDRDRLPLTPEKVGTLATAIAKEMTNQELMQSIFSLQDLWVDKDVLKSVGLDPNRDKWTSKGVKALRDSAGRQLLNALIEEATSYEYDSSAPNKNKRGLGAHFPPTYLADTGGVSDDIKTDLEKSGYKLCSSDFNRLGMLDVKTKWQEIRMHQALTPTPRETLQLNSLKEAASILAPYPQFKAGSGGQAALITPEDIKKPIFLFHKGAKKETSDTMAEYAKTHIWFDRSYLETATFGQALGTYYHEMLHKVAGDGSPDFGYALTELLEGHLDVSLNLKSKDFQRLQDLQALWQSSAHPKASASMNQVA